MSSISLEYETAFQPGKYQFPNKVTEVKVSNAVRVMAATLQRSPTRKEAVTTVTDVATGTKYTIKLTIP